MKQRAICVDGIAASDHENSHPNSSQADESRSLVTGSKIASSSLSSDLQPTPVITSHVGPFLEMEGDDEIDEEYHQFLLEEIPLNDEDDLLLSTVPLSNCGAPIEEEKKEEDENNNDLAADKFSRSRSSHLEYVPATVPSRDIKVRRISCGKRPRSSLRVSFPPAVQWSATSIPSAANLADRLEQDSRDSPQHRKDNQSLVRVRYTMSLSEYTLEERRATWYTYADLKSFKRERKDTARRIDNGVLSLPLSSIPLPHTVEQMSQCDIFIDDSVSSSAPIEYCSRGVENCTEAICRVRYRHIAGGWRAVLTTQENHSFQQQKLTSMSSAEQDRYRALAAFLGVGGKKASRVANGWLPYGSNGSSNSPNKSSQQKQKQFDDNMCCPYQIAAAYLSTSLASIDIARNRAIGDERDATAQRAQDQHEQASENKNKNERTVASNHNTAVRQHLANTNTTCALAESISKQKENRDDNTCNIEKL